MPEIEIHFSRFLLITPREMLSCSVATTINSRYCQQWSINTNKKYSGGYYLLVFPKIIFYTLTDMLKKPIVGDNFCYLSAFLCFWNGDALKPLSFPPKGLIRAQTRWWLPSWLHPNQFPSRRIAGKGGLTYYQKETPLELQNPCQNMGMKAYLKDGN